MEVKSDESWRDTWNRKARRTGHQTARGPRDDVISLPGESHKSHSVDHIRTHNVNADFTTVLVAFARSLELITRGKKWLLTEHNSIPPITA